MKRICKRVEEGCSWKYFDFFRECVVENYDGIRSALLDSREG